MRNQVDEVPTDEEIAFVHDMFSRAADDTGCGGCFAEFRRFIGRMTQKLIELTKSLMKDPNIFSAIQQNEVFQEFLNQSEEEMRVCKTGTQPEIASKEGDGVFSRIWKSVKNFFEKLWNITKKLAESFVKSIGALYKKSEKLVCSICVAIVTQIGILWNRIYKKVSPLYSNAVSPRLLLSLQKNSD